MRGLALLLAALPAAIALLPLTWWIARRRSRGEGITWLSRGALTAARRVDLVLLDRWGTVTTGELKVASVEPLDPDHDRNLRWFAGALGHAAEDPVARAVARLSTRGKLSGVEQYDGVGISGSVDRHPVRLGRPDWLGMEVRDGLGVTVGVQVDARPIGYITVADDVRLDAAEGVRRLREIGVEPVLVSDDTEKNTRHLAESCGIERWHAAIGPADRDALTAEHRDRGAVVASAGRKPVPSADLVLGLDVEDGARLTDLDVGRIATALALSRRCARAAARTRGFALAWGALGAVLAALGTLGVAGAAVAALAGCAAVGAVAWRA